jgi:multimeric flavodoxin WrbA
MDMSRLLVIHHTPSPSAHRLLEAVRAGTAAEGLDAVEVVVRPALAVTIPDVLDADGYLVGTTANFGYMSGALKHAFDTVYYPCVDATAGRPWGMWVHGNNDVDGAVSSVRKIVTGLGWTEVHDPVTVIGQPTRADDEACWELGATVAANLLEDRT